MRGECTLKPPPEGVSLMRIEMCIDASARIRVRTVECTLHIQCEQWSVRKIKLYA